MKRYNNLYAQIYDMDNIIKAHANARKGKLHYAEVKFIDSDPERYLSEIQEMLMGKTFKNAEYTTLIRKMDSGKIREIMKLPYFPDRIIQHCIVQVMEDIWVKTMIPGTYACLKKRGIHACAKKIKKDIQKENETRYCLKIDVKKFYPSIDHDVLKAILRRKIKDNDLLWLLDEIIDSAPGIPIGNYLSQYFGNLYLTGFDHWMKEQLGCKYYYRYCDDIVVLSDSKQRLHELRKAAEDYMARNLKLKMKENWQVFNVASRGIDFVGYRFFHHYTLLRTSIARKFVRKMRIIKKNHHRMTPVAVVNSIMSYSGWMQHADCRNLIHSHIDAEIRGIVAAKTQAAGMNNPLEGYYEAV
jgi:hypothetical protein